MTDDPNSILRALPHAIGPEKSILSSILQEPEEFLGVAAEEGLHAEHFYLPSHSTLYGFIFDLHAAGKPIEFVSLIQLLLDNGKLESVGGPSGVTDLYTYAPSPGHFRHHLRFIKDKHMLREIIHSGNEQVAMAHDRPDEPQEVLDAAEARIMRIRDQGEAKTATTKNDALRAVIQDIEDQIAGKVDTLGLTTGYPDLDRKTNGLKPGDIFIIAARPSMGKSALMGGMVEHIGLDLNLPVQVFSMEMSQKQLLQRMIGSRARFDFSSLSRGEKPDKGALIRIKRAYEQIHAAPIHIDDTPALTISALRAKARRAKSRHGIQAIAIDYLQLMRSTSRQAESSREREISEISGGIKALAKELGIPIILLAQLNRESEKRTGTSKGVPKMADLRESGSIEQDADYVGLLTRDAYHAANEDEKAATAGAGRLILAKNRTGPTGDIYLTFLPELVKFVPGTRPEAQEPTERALKF